MGGAEGWAARPAEAEEEGTEMGAVTADQEMKKMPTEEKEERWRTLARRYLGFGTALNVDEKRWVRALIEADKDLYTSILAEVGAEVNKQYEAATGVSGKVIELGMGSEPIPNFLRELAKTVKTPEEAEKLSNDINLVWLRLLVHRKEGLGEELSVKDKKVLEELRAQVFPDSHTSVPEDWDDKEIAETIAEDKGMQDKGTYKQMVANAKVIKLLAQEWLRFFREWSIETSGPNTGPRYAFYKMFAWWFFPVLRMNAPLTDEGFHETPEDARKRRWEEKPDANADNIRVQFNAISDLDDTNADQIWNELDAAAKAAVLYGIYAQEQFWTVTPHPNYYMSAVKTIRKMYPGVGRTWVEPRGWQGGDHNERAVEVVQRGEVVAEYIEDQEAVLHKLSDPAVVQQELEKLQKINDLKDFLKDVNYDSNMRQLEDGLKELWFYRAHPDEHARLLTEFRWRRELAFWHVGRADEAGDRRVGAPAVAPGMGKIGSPVGISELWQQQMLQQQREAEARAGASKRN